MLCTVVRSLLGSDLSRAVDAISSIESCGRGRERQGEPFEGFAESHNVHIVLEDFDSCDMLEYRVLKLRTLTIIFSAIVSLLHLAANVVWGSW
jgi:hypothetical protein